MMFLLLTLLPILSSAQEVQKPEKFLVNRSLELSCPLPPDTTIISSIVWQRTNEIIWSDNGTSLDDDRFKAYVDQMTLSMSQLQLPDTSVYSCEIVVITSPDNATNLLVNKQWDITVYDVPSPPQQVIVDAINATEVRLSFEPSETDNNAEILHYLFTAR
jgi:hypothetical protein